MKKQTKKITPAEVQEKWESLHVVLREHKEAKHLTNQDVGDAINVSAERVRKFFAGELANPNVFSVMALCNYLGLSLDALLGNPHGKAVADIEAEVASYKENAARLEAEVARLEQENAILQIKYENEQRFLHRVEKILRRTTIGVFVLLALCAVLVLTLSSYFRMDIANKHVGFVQDAYVAPMAVVVFAVLLAAVAIIIALIVGLFKENRKKGEDNNGD